MEIIELLLDEENDVTGIEAVSIVEAPAIESDFITLKSQEIQLAKVDDEKKILISDCYRYSKTGRHMKTIKASLEIQEALFKKLNQR